MARISKVYGSNNDKNIRIDKDSGAVYVESLVLNGTAVTSSAAELNIVDGVTATAAELNYNDIETLGTGAASKAVVLDAGDDYTWPATGVLTYGVLKDPAATTIGATGAELNLLDLSAQTETVSSAGAVSVTKRVTNLDSTAGGMAVTLAAPNAAMLGQVKIITHTVDNGDVTMALTNVTGGSAATTATFDAVNDSLILVAGVSKWHVVGEAGVALT